MQSARKSAPRAQTLDRRSETAEQLLAHVVDRSDGERFGRAHAGTRSKVSCCGRQEEPGVASAATQHETAIL
jgi:hypothetical protein